MVVTQVVELLDPSVGHSLVNVFPNHSDAVCREKYYDILADLRQKHVSFQGKMSPEMLAVTTAGDGNVRTSAVHARGVLRKALLRGLADESSIIRKKMYEYWDRRQGVRSVSGNVASAAVSAITGEASL